MDPHSSNLICSRVASHPCHENGLVVSLCVSHHSEGYILASVQHHWASEQWKNNLPSMWPFTPTAFSLVEDQEGGGDTFPPVLLSDEIYPPLLYLLNRKMLLRQLFFHVIHLSKFTFFCKLFCIKYHNVQSHLCLTKAKCLTDIYISYIYAFLIHTYIIYIMLISFKISISIINAEVCSEPH